MQGQRPGRFVTRRFHDDTRYHRVPGAEGDASIQMGTPPDLGPAMGEQDLALEPSPCKRYLGLDPIPLPTELSPGDIPALDVLAQSPGEPAGDAIPTLRQLARIAQSSNGIIRRWTTPWGKEVAFRAASCTGARYHLELYLVTGDLPGLPAGVYHYAPDDHALRLLRAGDFRGVLVAAAGDAPTLAAAPGIAVTSSVFWRNAWRYQDRTWRHAWWDAGTMLANLVAVARSGGLPTGIVTGFVDRSVNDLLGLDGDHEAALAMVGIGRAGEGAPPAPSVSLLHLDVEPSSPREIDFPRIREAHTASGFTDPAEVAGWRANPLRTQRVATPGTIPLQPIADDVIPADPIETVIGRRRSNRHYAGDQPLPFDRFSTVLDRALAAPAIDALDPAAPPLHDIYLVVNNVESVPPGAYRLDRETRALVPLRAGDARADAARLCCGQGYAAEAHVVVFALANLDRVLGHYGERGYRLAQLEAALFAGRLQLAAHALGLGAVGSTSPDDEVIDFFSPEAAGDDYLFVAVFGIPRRATPAETEQATRFIKRDDGA